MSTTLIEASDGYGAHKAGYILVDADTIVENRYVETRNGCIIDISSRRPAGPVTDHGPGVLMPAFVNGHLHLELSALAGMVPFENGFKNWVQQLLNLRDALPEKDLIEAGRQQAMLLKMTGTCFVGDISTLGIGKKIAAHTGLRGICFDEYLGSCLPETQRPQLSGDLALSYAGHAPHTTSPDVLAALKNRADRARLPFSIHVAESDDETQFIREKKGAWAQFLASRGITDWKNWGIGRHSPVSYLFQKNLLGPSTIAVHLLNIDGGDLVTLAKTQTRICLCPRSNFNLHKKLPDISGMLRYGLKPALGTDSLASCASLSIRDEMQFIHTRYPDISLRDIFIMGTHNGAAILGLDPICGTLHPGKTAAFVYQDTRIPDKNRLLEKVITNE